MDNLDAKFNRMMDFDSFLQRILTGYYDRENGTAQFKSDVLEHWGDRYEELYCELFAEHSDLSGRVRLEEVLSDFVKAI